MQSTTQTWQWKSLEMKSCLLYTSALTLQMYKIVSDKMLIFKKVASNVIRCHQMSGKRFQNK